MLLGIFSINAQTIIDFETDGVGYTPSATEGNSFTDVFNRINDDMTNCTNEDGYYWAVEDLTLTNPYIDLDQIDVTGSNSFTFSIDMLAHHYNDWDGTDELLITYSVDGGAYQNLMWVQMVPEGDGNGATNEPAALDIAFDGDGDCAFILPALTQGAGSQGCTVVSSDFATFLSSAISLSNNTTLDIKLQFNGLKSGDEGIYLDNIVITQAGVTPAEPVITGITHYPVAPISTDAVDVFATITDDVAVTDQQLYWSLSSPVTVADNNIAMTLVAGDVYTSTTSIPTQAEGVTVYYIIVAEDGDANVTTSDEQSYTIPTTEVLDWYNLQWPENGTIDQGNTFDVYAQAYEAGLTDAAGQGAGVDVWIGISTEDTNPNTWVTWIPATYGSDQGNNDEYTAEIGSALAAGTYYYASRFQLNGSIYTYGGFNGGAWDGSTNVSGVLTVTGTPMAYDLMISEVADPTDYEGRFVEIYNPSGSAVDFSSATWYLAKQSNGDSWTDVQLTGSIAAGGTYVVGTSNFNATYGSVPDLVSGIPNGNGDDGYFLYADGDQSTGTLIDAYGVLDQDGSGEAWEYENSIAVRNADIVNPRTDWTESEWVITAGDHTEATPGVHPNAVPTEPIISTIVHTPAVPTSGETVSVSAIVTDDVAVSTVELQWGIISGTYSATITMNTTGGNTYTTTTDIPAHANGTTVYYIVVAEDGDANITTSDEYSYTVTDPVLPTQVATIAELRAGATDGTVYELTGEAILSFQYSYNNRKYIQDVTAGILIEDAAAIISTTYNLYDGIIGITGTLNESNGVLQFIPTENSATANSSGNVITPEVAIIDAINTTVDDYESELVVLNNVTFADGGATFTANTNYNVSDGAKGTIVFRSPLNGTDYIGTTIPAGPVNLTALVYEYNGTAQVFARNLADIETIVVTDPVISNVLHTPTAPNSSETVSVSATIVDDVSLATTELHWGTAMGTYTATITMDNGGTGDVYTTTTSIPALSNGTTVYYEIYAVDGDANSTTTSEYSYTVFDMPTNTLFFSEYIEGSGQNKALEIYNPTGATVDLTNYRVAYANNGGDWSIWHTFTVTTSVNAGDVVVLAADGCDAAIAAVADEILTYPNVVFFNGDDALAIEMTTDGGATWNIVDIIGDPNTDPGSGWEVAGTANGTSNHTLVRKYPDVTSGNNDWVNSAGTNADDSEWIVNDEDDFTFIGWHGEISNDPTLTIVSPTEGSTVVSEVATIVLDVDNFTVAPPSDGDGYVLAILNGDSFDIYSTTFDFGGLVNGTYTLTTTLVDNSGTPLDPNVTDIVTFYVELLDPTTIYDIQYTTDGSGDSPLAGEVVQTSGIVTAITLNGNYFLQDGDGAWNGIFVYDNTYYPQIGDELTITAEVIEYNGLTELSNISYFAINSTGNTLPNASVLTTLAANNEQYEGVLIRVIAECVNADAGFGSWILNDGTGDLIADDDIYVYTPTATYNYNITGIGHYSYGEYKILPRSADDIMEIWGINEQDVQISVYPNPATDVVTISGDIKNVDLFSTLGQKVDARFANNTINVSGLTAGIYIARITLSNGEIVTKQIVKK